MDASGAMLEEYSYDPWGRRRSPADWLTTDVTAPGIITRGYTGHEHLDDFGLIHMNGRIYDPHVGRILNPDPIIQEPLNIQNYNRYSYCLNNPLKYTDPSGYKKKKKTDNDGCGVVGNTQQDREIDFSWFFNWIQGIGRGGSSGRQRNGGSGNSGGSEAFTYISGIYTSLSVPYMSSMSGFGGGSGGNGSGSFGSGGSVQGAGFAVPQSQGGNIYNVKNYGGIIGLTVLYYKDDRNVGRAVLEVSYSSEGINGAKWKQWCKDTDYSDMSSKSHWDGDNPPFYYTDADMAKHTNGNTVDFYDWPRRTTAGSYEFALTLYQPGVGNLLQINWGLTRYSNGTYFISPLIVKKF